MKHAVGREMRQFPGTRWARRHCQERTARWLTMRPLESCCGAVVLGDFACLLNVEGSRYAGWSGRRRFAGQSATGLGWLLRRAVC